MPKLLRRGPPPLALRGMPERLREARKEARLGVVELEERAGVGRGRVSRIEHGHQLEGITLAIVQRLAAALGINVGWLASGEPPKRPRPLLMVEDGIPDRESILEAIRQEVRAALPPHEEPGKVRRPSSKPPGSKRYR